MYTTINIHLLEKYYGIFEDTELMDTASGEIIGSGLSAILTKDELDGKKIEFIEYPREKIEREKRVLTAFESINESLCGNL